MIGSLLLLPEQCEPFDEFIAMVKNTQAEIEDPRALEYYGRGYMSDGIIENHGYILEELLYPLIDRCNPHKLDMVVTKFHIEVQLK